jgi:SAM-dependent methyltransferase
MLDVLEKPESRLQPSPAEFDDYAEDYSAGMDNPVKRLLGRNPEQFLEVKARWLLRDWRPCAERFRAERRLPVVLDYGCGVGTMLKVLKRLGLRASLVGCDPSARMVAKAREEWSGADVPRFFVHEQSAGTFARGSFDLIIVSAVLHHVPPADRPEVYRELLRLLRPGGRVYVFEHNPFNPVTQWVVRHTPIDRNAVLLRAGEVVRSLRALGAVGLRRKYLMFFPPAWAWSRRLEDWLGWLPLGGQYVVRAEAVTPRFRHSPPRSTRSVDAELVE